MALGRPGRPSPAKKQRTDNNSASEADAQAIAQTNSTLQHFLGRRQNRWLEEYVPPAVVSDQPQGVVNVPVNEPSITAMPRDSGKEGATFCVITEPENSHADTRGNANDSPRFVNNNTTTMADKISRDPSRNLHTTQTVGLPSPALSDGNTISPAIRTPDVSQQTNAIVQDMISKKHGRPGSTDNTYVTPSSNTSSAHPTPHQGQIPQKQQQQQQQSHSRSTSIPQDTRYARLQSASTPVVMHGQGRTRVPWQNAVTAGHVPYQMNHSDLSPVAMQQRFQHFMSTMVPGFQLTKVDNGRLALLREAVTCGDLFYMCLSQIHCLTSTPNYLPLAIRELPLQSFRYLDFLICPTTMLSNEICHWLSNFPAPISRLFAEQASVYEPLVQQVTAFLRLLPQRWNQITEDSKKRDAPPLIEDLVDHFQLTSSVFQTTAFRAIARLVVPSSYVNPEATINTLETLHKMDRTYFERQGRRSTHEKTLAYHALKAVITACKQHEKRLQVFEKTSRPGSGLKPPLFKFPPQAVTLFTAGASAGTAQQMTAQQQQQVVASNTRALGSRQRVTNPVADHAMTANPSTAQQLAAIQSRTASTPQQSHLPAQAFVFPRTGEQPRAQPTNPDSTRSALHQAHLRSPRLGIKEPHGDTKPSDLYRHVIGFALSPQKLQKNAPVQTFSFNVAKDSFDKIASTSPSECAGKPASRNLTTESHTYRLRCALCPGNDFPNESTWVTAENQWPGVLFLEFNGHILETRRKLHHSRYLPIDLTSYVQRGQNLVLATVNRTSTDTRPFEYVLAVEVVGVISHEAIKQQVRTIPDAETATAIKTSLLSTSDDDDIAITTSNLTIKLFDPFSSAKMVETPVRGSACAHKDCFDLETFLSLRERKHLSWPSVVDCWRCPICRGDVRPQTLVVDGFLVEVRKQLQERNLLNTRAIVVEADGSWKPKEEERTGERSPSLEREERVNAQKHSSLSIPKKVVEIIEID